MSREIFIFIDMWQYFIRKSALSSIVLPSDRHEIEIGINQLSNKDKNIIQSIDEIDQQVLSVIATIEDSIKNHYGKLKQQLVEKAEEYFNEMNVSDNNDNDNNIAIQLVKFLFFFMMMIFLLKMQQK